MNSAGQLSFRRILSVLVPIVVLVFGGYLWWSNQVQATAKSDMARNILLVMLGDNPPARENARSYADANGDLLADAPLDEECITPDPLVFSYIAADDSSDDKSEAWAGLLDTLSERLGCQVIAVHFSTTAEQLDALKSGKLHLTGFNTGAVESAVDQAGFLPICTLGHDDGTYGYTMKIIVPSSSDVHEIKELRGKMVTFTRPTSNSGFKAAFELLQQTHGMLPERDYQWSFSLDHDNSIRLVAEGKTDSAAVASDVLAKLVENGDIEANSLRTIYESERFPPAAIGSAYNLSPRFQSIIREVLLGLEFSGTGLEQEFVPMGASRFVPINYKNDWANIRRIDQSLEIARVGR